MGLFDLFSNDTAEEAARQRNQGLESGYRALEGNYGKGREALTTGYTDAGNVYGGLDTYFKSLYEPGARAYGDATGAYGAEGQARARANFQTDPGYQFQMDQGLQGLSRAHSAAGNLSSGNADADAIKYATGLADQSYGNYVSRLAPYLNLAGSGATTAAAGRANAATGLGTGLGTTYLHQGNAANTNYTGQGASDAAATMNNYNIGSNQLGLVTGLGQLAFGLPPTGFSSIGGGGGGGGGSSGGPASGLTGMFTGGAGGSPSPASYGFSTMFGNGTGYQTNPWSSAGMFGGFG